MQYGQSNSSVDAAVTLEILRTLQGATQVQVRHQLAELVAAAVNRAFPPRPHPAAPGQQQASKLKSDGCVRLGQILTPDQVAETMRYLRARPCFNGHVAAVGDGTPRHVGSGAEEFHYGSYPLTDIMAAPHLLELANLPEILDVAERYLGCTPTLYSLNAWWSFSGHGRAPVAQHFHRDLDDYRFCTMFVFLTDVGMEDGAHSFIRYSHSYALTERIVRRTGPRVSERLGRPIAVDDLYAGDASGLDDLYGELFAGLVDTVTGPAGFAFFADTSGLHKGIPLVRGQRLMFWARYGLYRNTTNRNDGLIPVPRAQIGDRIAGDARSAYINRCLIAP